MKNKNLMNRVIMLFTFLLVTSTSFAQITTEEDVAKAVFKTIKNADLETFLSYCISEDRKTKMLNGITGSTEMEKSIKQELEREKVKILRDGMKNNFNKFLDELKKEGISYKDVEYKEIEGIDHQFEITNLKCYDIKYEVLFNENNYRFEINLYEIKDDIFIYGFRKIN